MADAVDLDALERVIDKATQLAKEYRRITGKPLGITGEVGEFLVAKILGLTLAEARQAGYDALAPDGRHVQIKARCAPRGSNPGMLGSIRLDHDWQTVVLVLMDADFMPYAIYEAQRADIERELTRPGSKARNVRGALSVRKFRSIASQIWSS